MPNGNNNMNALAGSYQFNNEVAADSTSGGFVGVFADESIATPKPESDSVPTAEELFAVSEQFNNPDIGTNADRSNSEGADAGRNSHTPDFPTSTAFTKAEVDAIERRNIAEREQAELEFTKRENSLRYHFKFRCEQCRNTRREQGERRKLRRDTILIILFGMGLILGLILGLLLGA